MNNIGETLQEARESAGVSLSEASNDLDIRVEILENIEEGKTGAFKDIFELKEYISLYAKYLGLNEEELIDEFNDYMFEYTSKIPVKEIEKTIEQMNKEEKKEDKEEVISPYTKKPKKYKKSVYIVIYLLLIVMILLAVIWSVKQVTINQNTTNTISYGGK